MQFQPKTSIYDLLYTLRLASQILQDQQISFWSIIKVEIPDPNQPDIVIHYNLGGADHTYTTSAYEFWQPFSSMRLFRSQDYSATPEGELWDVQSLDDSNKPPYSVNLAVEGEGRCDCPDLQNQAALLQQHPWLWEAIEHKPNCKHCFAAMGKSPTARECVEIVFPNPNPLLPSSVDAMAMRSSSPLGVIAPSQESPETTD